MEEKVPCSGDGDDHNYMTTSLDMIDFESGNQQDNHEETGSHERGQWTSRLDYILSMVGYCVGFGNLWRFPYICNRNGGGAFLIPFALFLVITAFPMFYLESCLGQFSGKGGLHVWSFCPLLKGIGIGVVFQMSIYLVYYNILLAWPIYYMVKSCSSVLPWTTCGNWWNTELCVKDVSALGRQDANISLIGTTFSKLNLKNQWNISTVGLWINQTLAHTAVEEFYQYNVLGISSGLHEIGSIQWHILGCLSVAYFIIFLCLFRGVKATGKVVYVTAVLPYILLTAVFIRVVTLPGAVDGIVYYIKPDFRKLLEVQVWIEASVQVFYSLGPGWGMVMTSSSYNKFHEPLFSDSVILCAVSEGTSMFSGFVTFSVLGVMADRFGVAVSEVVSSGPGLGFVAYTEALAELPLPQLWAFLFFLMLLSIGLDSQFLSAEVLSTAIIDQFPQTLRKRRIFVTATLCCIPFLLGIILCSQGGIYVFQLLDWYIVSVSLFLICALECVASVWLYAVCMTPFNGVMQSVEGKVRRFYTRQTSVLENFTNKVRRSQPEYRSHLKRVPSDLRAESSFLMCMSLLKYQPPTYGSYVYPYYASVIGWIIAMIPVVPIPICMFNVIREQSGKSIKKKLMLAILPDSEWRPAVPTFAVKYREELIKNRKTFKENLRFIFKK